jgi:hypothetical protein
MVLVQPAARM